MQSIGSPGLWLGFIAFVLAMLALDLGVFHRKAHAPSTREALLWSLVWIALAGAFAGSIYYWFGSQRALEFVTGYVVEKALSVDNLFVFVVLFGAFKVPLAAQHRVLFWGVLGALVLRGAFIAAGGALVAKFHWVMYGFGAFLVFTAVKLWLARHEEDQAEKPPGEGRLFRVFRRFLPTTPELDGARFFTRKSGKWLATPLLLVLFLVEGTDVIFAVDSVPAVFGITRDPFIVFTSNVMAILGLRSLYFVLAELVTRFYYLKHALAVVLGFVGVELLLIDVYHLPIAASLGFIVVTLGVAVLASWRREQRLARAEAEAQAAPRGASADKSSSISSMLKGFSN